MKIYKKIPLFYKIMIGLALGIIAGLILGPEASMFEILGTIMVRLFQLVVAPLIMCLMISTIGSVTDMKSFGGIALKTLITYVCFTMIAIVVGLSLSLLIDVGVGASIDISSLEAAESASLSLKDTILNMVPQNIFAALSENKLIQVIVFSLIFGLALTKLDGRGQGIIHAFDVLSDTMKVFVNIVLEVVPFGVFGLMANVIGTNGISILLPYLKALLALYLAVFFQTVILHTGVVGWLICKVSPKRFLIACKETIAFAFASCSSVATIPLALKAVRRLGVPDRIGNFIVTIGSNMSMDGIAIYQGVAVVFASQLFGIELTFAQYITVMLAATVASLGSAGIPGAGLIILTIVLETVGLPLEAVGIMAGVDRLLDMGRTVANVTADIAASCLVSKLEGGLLPESEIKED